MSETRSQWTSSGFSIQPFGKGRNAIQHKHANDLVDSLNIVGNIKIQRGMKDQVLYSARGVTLQIKSASLEAAEASFPFQIYQTGSWLKYKVKTGIVITTGNPITATGIESEFTIGSGVLRYWFYMEMTATTAQVKTSPTTLEWSADKIPIGWVDTSTSSGTSIAYIYQVIKDHIFNPCAGTT
jgi:hypothetical protein